MTIRVLAVLRCTRMTSSVALPCWCAQVAGLQAEREDDHAVIRVKRETLAANQAALEESKQCTVCFDRDVDVALTGCGHAFCEVCVDGLPAAVCPTCRAGITGVTKLLFP